MPVAVNDMVYDISISLNRVFFFEFVDWVRFGAPPKDPAKKGLSYFGIFEKQDSSQIKPQQVVAS